MIFVNIGIVLAIYETALNLFALDLRSTVVENLVVHRMDVNWLALASLLRSFVR